MANLEYAAMLPQVFIIYISLTDMISIPRASGEWQNLNTIHAKLYIKTILERTGAVPATVIYHNGKIHQNNQLQFNCSNKILFLDLQYRSWSDLSLESQFCDVINLKESRLMSLFRRKVFWLVIFSSMHFTFLDCETIVLFDVCCQSVPQHHATIPCQADHLT